MPQRDGTPASQAVVRESEKVLAEKTSIPDGPNVAPSPLEHLAAQGVVSTPANASDDASTPVAGPSEASGSPMARPPSSAGDDPVEPVNPAEQALVDEQLARDSALAERAKAPASNSGPGGARHS